MKIPEVQSELYQQEVVDWLGSLRAWETFFTGTVKPRKVFQKGTLGFKIAAKGSCAAVPSGMKYNWATMDKTYISARSLMQTFERFMRTGYRQVSYVYALEPFSGNNGFHVHAMFADAYGLKWTDFWKDWFTLFGRNKTEPIRLVADVNNYVSKYIQKEWTFKNDYRKTVNAEREIWWNVKLNHAQFPQRDLKHK